MTFLDLVFLTASIIIVTWAAIDSTDFVRYWTHRANARIERIKREMDEADERKENAKKAKEAYEEYIRHTIL